jgi:hypothetical protein
MTRVSDGAGGYFHSVRPFPKANPKMRQRRLPNKTGLDFQHLPLPYIAVRRRRG